MSGRQSLQPPKLTQIAPKAIDTDRRGSPTRMNHIANRRQQRRVNQRRPQTKEHCSRHPHPASESKFSILYFQHLQNRSVKMYVHALHTAHALPDLPATAGRLGTTTSNLRICFGRIRLCLCHARQAERFHLGSLVGTLITIFGNVPIINQLTTWSINCPPSNWMEVGVKWWLFQTVRTILQA